MYHYHWIGFLGILFLRLKIVFRGQVFHLYRSFGHITIMIILSVNVLHTFNVVMFLLGQLSLRWVTVYILYWFLMNSIAFEFVFWWWNECCCRYRYRLLSWFFCAIVKVCFECFLTMYWYNQIFVLYYIVLVIFLYSALAFVFVRRYGNRHCIYYFKTLPYHRWLRLFRINAMSTRDSDLIASLDVPFRLCYCATPSTLFVQLSTSQSHDQVYQLCTYFCIIRGFVSMTRLYIMYQNCKRNEPIFDEEHDLTLIPSESIRWMDTTFSFTQDHADCLDIDHWLIDDDYRCINLRAGWKYSGDLPDHRQWIHLRCFAGCNLCGTESECFRQRVPTLLWYMWLWW